MNQSFRNTTKPGDATEMRRTSETVWTRESSATHASSIQRLWGASGRERSAAATITITDVTGASLGVFTQNYTGVPTSPLPNATQQQFDFDSGLPALKSRFTDLGASASVFPYDPV